MQQTKAPHPCKLYYFTLSQLANSGKHVTQHGICWTLSMIKYLNICRGHVISGQVREHVENSIHDRDTVLELGIGATTTTKKDDLTSLLLFVHSIFSLNAIHLTGWRRKVLQRKASKTENHKL